MTVVIAACWPAGQSCSSCLGVSCNLDHNHIMRMSARCSARQTSQEGSMVRNEGLLCSRAQHDTDPVSPHLVPPWMPRPVAGTKASTVVVYAAPANFSASDFLPCASSNTGEACAAPAWDPWAWQATSHMAAELCCWACRWPSACPLADTATLPHLKRVELGWVEGWRVEGWGNKRVEGRTRGGNTRV